ncbi:MAG TPA: DNA-protecting protein DprA [Clostridiales bacterium]|jgi:DNA processing protein|nr:DNA-protecting protein DprA [Clostridiales bacterium]
MNKDNRQELYKLWIGSIPIKAYKIKAIIEYFGSPEDAYYASDHAMEEMMRTLNNEGIRFTKRNLDAVLLRKDLGMVKKNMEYIQKQSIKYLTMLDESYPGKLRNIYDPPFLLYYKGVPLPDDKRVISIVGARECSVYGRETAKYLAGALANEGIVIISGLARGIDSYAHIGALAAEGVTYGIMGCGIDICYPVENINLYMDMQANGGIISEYGPGVNPLAYHFPMRNRIISALSDGIVVIEAKEKSGSLITVDLGLEQGKNIYAVPGRITDKLSAGCNNLIKMGAKPVTSPQDILEDFPGYDSIMQKVSSQPDQIKLTGLLSSEEQAVYDIIDLSPKHIEELICLTGFEMGKLMEYLLSLELKDLIYQPVKNRYTRNVKLFT